VYLIHIFGDLIAMIKALGTLGVGAIKPCHSCHIEAICDIQAKRKTYYLPLTIPGHPENRLQEILNNPRTHKDYLQTYRRLDSAATEAERKRIQKETGIKHRSIFALLPYFDMGRAVPGGFMHAVYINLFKALIKLWRGEFKGLDAGTGNYIIPAPIWERIGIETRNAVKSIPASFVRSIPNIDTDFGNFTAEDSAFWMTWLAPYLLADRLPPPYYEHLLDLVKIVTVPHQATCHHHPACHWYLRVSIEAVLYIICHIISVELVVQKRSGSASCGWWSAPKSLYRANF